MRKKNFAVLGGVLFLFFLINMIIIHTFDTDLHFLVASGREIINNGIVHNNVWIIDSESGIVIQQWLYCVLLAFIDQLGIYGIYAFVFVEIILLGVVVFCFFKVKGIDDSASLICTCIIYTFSQSYLFSIRPEAITIILLMTECLALDKWKKTGKNLWLIIIPITVFLEVNLHASIWPMHFALIFAYVVPSFYSKEIIDESVWKKWKPLLCSVLVSAIVLFINPYGIKSVGYSFLFAKAKVSQFAAGRELQIPVLVSGTSIVIIISCLLIVYALRKKALTSVALHVALGLTLLSVIMVRNVMFSTITIAFLLRDVINCTFFLKNRKELVEGIKNYVYPFLIIGIACEVIVPIFSIINNTETYSVGLIRDLSPICDYLDENHEEGDHIFTGFNTGAYLEYRGYKNIYIDARPELYTSEFTGDKNILRDYSRLCAYGLDLVEGEDSERVTKEEIDAWLDEYDFEYLVIQPKAERFLHAYLLSCDTYHIVDSASCDEVLLFERTK